MRKPVLLAACLVSLSSRLAVTQTTITVGQGGKHDHSTIQAGIDAATTGDTVLVYPGTYVENIHFNGKSIILQSTDPTDTATVAATIIDGNSSGSVVTCAGTETSSCVLSGFTIQNGLANRGGGIAGQGTHAVIAENVITSNSAGAGHWGTYGSGGGIRDCDGIIAHNIVTGNTGGGLSHCDGTILHNIIANNLSSGGGGLRECQGDIVNNTITNNAVIGRLAPGGGLYLCHGTIQDNTISWNSAVAGGGGLDSCNGTVQGNRIENNSSASGGGLAVCGGTIRNNTISNNSALYGGGLSGCHGTIEANAISDNSATYMSFGGGGLYSCQATIRSNVICGNRTNASGGGLYSCNGTVGNNTIADNMASMGGGLSQCLGVIVNNIVWANSATSVPVHLSDCSTPSYCCIQDWPSGGTGNISDNPLFTTGPLGSYYLSQIAAGQSAQSPCVDTGSSTSLELGLHDRTTSTDERPDTGMVDMGYHYPVLSPPSTSAVDRKRWLLYP